MTFNALMLTREEGAPPEAQITQLNNSDLPQDGDVTIAIAFSGLNYKDGLCLLGKAGLVRSYPHIAGIDFAGTVIESDDKRYQEGDQVVLTGWRVGEAWWGGYAERARVKADWLVPLPDGMTAEAAMGVGTAGLTAMLGILALENHDLTPDSGEILVTGASGGVGSLATAMLAKRGYQVAAVTGKATSASRLEALGARQIIPREELAEASDKPMESSRWAGCIDSVGGTMLARVLGQLNYGGSVAAIGNAGGVNVPASIIPFLLRGINLLGIDSVMQPYDNRVAAWREVKTSLDVSDLKSMTEIIGLEALPHYAKSILKGEISGRVIVNPSL